MKNRKGSVGERKSKGIERNRKRGGKMKTGWRDEETTCEREKDKKINGYRKQGEV